MDTQTYWWTEESWARSMRARARRGELREKFWILGVTDLIKHDTPRDRADRQHAGQDGQDATTRARVENPSVAACPLREASARNQGDVRKLAGRVQIEAQSPVKDFCPVTDHSVKAPVEVIGGQPGRAVRGWRGRVACKRRSLEASTKKPATVVAA